MVSRWEAYSVCVPSQLLCGISCVVANLHNMAFTVKMVPAAPNHTNFMVTGCLPAYLPQEYPVVCTATGNEVRCRVPGH